MYGYRNLTPDEKEDILRARRLSSVPLHSPPHLYDGAGWHLITAATYEHRPHIAGPADRAALLAQIFAELGAAGVRIGAWVVLPNHYHLLVCCERLGALSLPIQRVHGRTARAINLRDGVEGRRVWCRFTDRAIRNERHYFTTTNYIHENPVRHGYVLTATDWDSSSIHWYQEQLGEDQLATWRSAYPLLDYGNGWDDP